MMKILRPLSLAALLALPLALSACESALAVGDGIGDERLAGTWVREREPAPPGEIREQVVYGADGTYVRDVRYYGYNAQSANELSGFYKAEGQYRLNGDRLEMRLVRETHWDALTGGEPTVDRHFGGWVDAGTVRIEGDTLIRTYTTYPADAPVETIVRYHRSGEG